MAQRPLSEARKDFTRGLFQHVLELQGRTQTTLAAEIGVDQSRVSQALRHGKMGVGATVKAAKIAGLVESNVERALRENREEELQRLSEEVRAPLRPSGTPVLDENILIVCRSLLAHDPAKFVAVQRAARRLALEWNLQERGSLGLADVLVRDLERMFDRAHSQVELDELRARSAELRGQVEASGKSK